MAYRNGTYVAFYADGTDVPTDSDIRYYNLLKAWTAKEDDDFSMINSHDKTAAVRDSSKDETLRTRLRTRLGNSKHLLLIIGETTKNDTDWVPFEICYAIDECEIPVIAAYTDYDYVLEPLDLSNLWPSALKTRIYDDTAKVLHIPFRKEPIKAAIEEMSPTYMPEGPLVYYTRDAYKKWGLIE